jgi:hypothetical protein
MYYQLFLTIFARLVEATEEVKFFTALVPWMHFTAFKKKKSGGGGGLIYTET